MQVPLRVGASVPLSEHWQRPTTDRESLALYARARGRCFLVSFPTRPNALASLVFRNFYAASLRLVQLNADGSTRVLLAEYPLMKHVHCEDDAQHWHLIHFDQLDVKPDVSQLEALQFYLFQPSPRFETWDLHQLMLYESRATDVTNAELAPNPRSALSVTTESPPTPSMHQLMRRLSRTSMLVVDARDVRENASQILSRVHQLRQLIHNPAG